MSALEVSSAGRRTIVGLLGTIAVAIGRTIVVVRTVIVVGTIALEERALRSGVVPRALSASHGVSIELATVVLTELLTCVVVKTLLFHKGDEALKFVGLIVELVACLVEFELPGWKHEAVECVFHGGVVGKEVLSAGPGEVDA